MRLRAADKGNLEGCSAYSNDPSPAVLYGSGAVANHNLTLTSTLLDPILWWHHKFDCWADNNLPYLLRALVYIPDPVGNFLGVPSAPGR